MRLVFDVLFLEHVTFKVAVKDYAYCRTGHSREEVLRKAMELVGLELVEYDSFTDTPVVGEGVRVHAYSLAFRERAERDSARKRKAHR